jgi:hypothetical protein
MARDIARQLSYRRFGPLARTDKEEAGNAD